MQFVPKGPDIPELLLQKQEDGEVVFFCGAGVSYPAGLPGFGGLVNRLFDSLGVVPSPVQKAALSKGQFDTAIGLLEKEIVGGRPVVRRKLAEILTVDDALLPTALGTHQALLTLAADTKGRTRIITTNFDRLFEHASSRWGLQHERFVAPLLPVPKSRWHGLVYLHGLLPDGPSAADDALHRLVISSADFGRAYLTERWAARFVSELFRHYTVCFVGYSLDDPVLRYMMDALAADRLLGEATTTAYAFANYRGSGQSKANDEWKARGVSPILYRCTGADHSLLHKTLRAWADTYRDGITGKESIIVKHAAAAPSGSSSQDNYVGRMLWAFSDRSGLVAKRFALLEPLPPFEWLTPFCDGRFGYGDLVRFGVAPERTEDTALNFSLAERPAPYSRSPRMALVTYASACVSWDPVMQALAVWMLRHLDDPRLLLWVVARGGALHPNFANAITQRLTAEPPISPYMQTLWKLLLSGRVRNRSAAADIYGWMRRLTREGPSFALQLQLLDLLSPRVVLRQPVDLSKLFGGASAAASRLKDVVNWELVLAAEHVHHALSDLRKSPSWEPLLRRALSDITGLLQETLDLSAMLGGATESSDLSYIVRPSIEDHAQNHDSSEWSALIVILRDAWLAVMDENRARARAEVERWRAIKYPLFARLVLFAATVSDVCDVDVVTGILMDPETPWLWSVETQIETLKLLARIGEKYGANCVLMLEGAVLAGPPRTMFRTDVEEPRLTRIMDSQIVERLQALQASGSLSEEGKARLDAIISTRPELRVDDEKRRFPVWVDSGFALDTPVATPIDRQELADWLVAHAQTSPRSEGSDWVVRCQRDLKRPLTALLAIAARDDWTVTLWWQEALQAWSTEAYARRSWRYLWRTLERAPDTFLIGLLPGVTWWLMNVAKYIDATHKPFFSLMARVVHLLKAQSTSGDEEIKTVESALNHPVGYMAQALFHIWYNQKPSDGSGLPPDVRAVLTEFQDTAVDTFAYARIFTASNVISLFRVDPDWTRTNLIPRFSWSASRTEARIAWEGFLWAPRLYPPLMVLLKKDFIATASHYQALGDHRLQYAGFLTYVALELRDEFSKTELAQATALLSEEGLGQALRVIINALEAAGDRRGAYWQNRIVPYLKDTWPKTLATKTKKIADGFARLCLAAGDAFPLAVRELEPWLEVYNRRDIEVQQLKESKLCERFPQDALHFLDLIVGDLFAYAAPDLDVCLNQIVANSPSMSSDPRLIRLREVVRRAD